MVVLLLILACKEQCPPGLHSAPYRAWEVRDALSKVNEPVPQVRLICFGEQVEEGVSRDGLMRLDASEPVFFNTARMAHLGLHMQQDPLDCGLDDTTATALEAQAWCHEVAVQERLQLIARNPREAQLRSLSPEECLTTMLRSPEVRHALASRAQRCGVP